MKLRVEKLGLDEDSISFASMPDWNFFIKNDVELMCDPAESVIYRSKQNYNPPPLRFIRDVTKIDQENWHTHTHTPINKSSNEKVYKV